MIRRINLFAGAGAGKSTTAAGIFNSLKKNAVKVELVTEYIKKWAWEGKKPTGFDQMYIFGKQLRAEEVPLKSGADIIVTDSPILLSPVYGKKYGFTCYNVLEQVEQAFTETYPELNIFLSRGSKPYDPRGRFESEEDARAVDVLIEEALKNYKKKYFKLDFSNFDAIIQLVNRELGVPEVDKVQQIIKMLNDFGDDYDADQKRKEVLGEFCRYCGCKNPMCQCWNDE